MNVSDGNVLLIPHLEAFGDEAIWPSQDGRRRNSEEEDAPRLLFSR